MSKRVFSIFTLVVLLTCQVTAQESNKAATVELSAQDAGMKLRIDCFEQLVNDVLEGITARAQLDPFFLNDDDVDHWMGQFEFTEEVLKEISREGFYNRLQGWAGSAKQNFITSLSGTDRFEVSDFQFKYGDDPRLRVSSTANLLINLYRAEDFVGSLQMTLIDVRGQLKLIQVN